jgi:hypothetical protein
MSSKEFVIWLKGFIAASNNYNVTPKQFDELKDTLSKVNDSELPDIQYFPYTQVKAKNYTETRTDKI